MTGVPARVRHLTVRMRQEAGLLSVGLAVTAALWGFVSLADEVADGETGNFDRAVLLALRNPADPADPLGPVWLEQTAKDLTSLGGFPVTGLITALALVYLLMIGRKGAAALVVISIGGGMLLSSGLKLLFARARPDLVPHAVDVFTASFPSGHATMTAAVYFTLGALLMRVVPARRLKIFVMASVVAIVLIVGASRVYLGVHWPTDVLAGWCIGFAWATLWWLVAALLQRRGRIDGDQPESGDVTRPSD
jgi:undecaprenyl-diphosphatase